jgi:acetolactate synthase small subunit
MDSFASGHCPRSSLRDAPTACFSIIADAEPGVMPRVMAMFAKRGLIPTAWFSRVSAGELSIDLQIESLDAETARYLAACFKALPSVIVVLTSDKPCRQGTGRD